MKYIIRYEKEELKRIKLESLLHVIKAFNNDTTNAHFKRYGDEAIDVIIAKKKILKEICEELGIKYFEKREDYITWQKTELAKLSK
jgi:hypothetical protein